MARTTQRMPKSERRALVLATATDAFIAHGFRGTSMEEIARAVGVTKPVLYQHFDSKEELYLMVVEGAGARILAAARSLPPLTGTPEERARGAINRVRGLSDDHLGVRLLLSEEEVSRPVSALVTGLRTQLARVISQAIVRRPALPDRTAVVLGRCLIALAADGVLRPLLSAESTQTSTLDLDVLSRFIAGGIAGFEGAASSSDGAHELV